MHILLAVSTCTIEHCCSGLATSTECAMQRRTYSCEGGRAQSLTLACVPCRNHSASITAARATAGLTRTLKHRDRSMS